MARQYAAMKTFAFVLHFFFVEPLNNGIFHISYHVSTQTRDRTYPITIISYYRLLFLAARTKVPNDKMFSIALVVDEGIMRNNNANRMYHK
ncbi:hypothetical protein MTR_8g058580 [Medicago truncatula]|uniref:Transmembrane protein n=1 Tax=Medicago truncatula TaxID=3880 RepID=G7LC06_MEDTR|nr:hypothetical protein MTR_8g058580 [Medicago truncatula]